MNILSVQRVMESDDATASLVGFDVPDLSPKLTAATLAADAETGEPVLAYLPYDGDLGRLRRAACSLDISFAGVRRTNGKDTRSAVIGYMPRRPVQLREACRPSLVAVERPDAHRVLVDAAVGLNATLRSVLPVQAQESEETSAAILPEWRMADGTMWTSGVVNRTATLPYHRDRNNFDVWSAMPVLRRGVRGGHLHLPEYDLVVECRDGWVVYFPGRRLVHGVTPMQVVEPDGYRITIVYYALRGMKDCFTTAVEQSRSRAKRSEREDTIAAGGGIGGKQ